MNIVDKAFLFAKTKHDATGKQYNGQPYIIHPTTTYYILAIVSKGDENLLAAGYLHDTLEDTNTTYEELVKEFNEDVASLVKEVTKDENKDFPNIKTGRGLMLKVADRLANVGDLDNASPEKKVKLFRKYSYGFIHEGTVLKNSPVS